MMTEARRKQWLTLSFSRNFLHMSSVCIAAMGIVAGETVLMLAEMSIFVGYCVAVMALSLGLFWAWILDVREVKDSVALTAMRQLAVAKVVILLIFLPFQVGIVLGFFVDVGVLVLAGAHTTIAMGRGVRSDFARQQAEIDEAEGQVGGPEPFDDEAE